MSTELIAFYAFGALLLIGALFVLFTRNVLYAAFALMLALLSVAALYVLAYADFVAVAQLVVYVGGVLILLIFGIMLTNRLSDQSVLSGVHNRFWGFVLGLLTAGILLFGVVEVPQSMLGWLNAPTAEPISESTVQTLGFLLMTNYSLAFELAGVLLLIALIGALFLARRPEELRS